MENSLKASIKGHKIEEFDVYRDNPFKDEMITRLSSLPDRPNKFVRKEMLTVDQVGNILSEDDYLMATVKKVDPDEFTKIFHNELKGLGLSSKASYFVLFIAGKLGKHEMYVDIHYDDINTEFPISRQTFYRVIKELLFNNVLARTKYSYRFFINPMFMYNGNRITVVKQYIKAGSDEARKAIYSDDQPMQMIDENIPLDQAQQERERRLEQDDNIFPRKGKPEDLEF